MVKEILEPKYLCEYPGCWERYKSWQEAKDCQDQGLIGPNLKPGLVLGKSGYRMIPIKNEDKDNDGGGNQMRDRLSALMEHSKGKTCLYFDTHGALSGIQIDTQGNEMTPDEIIESLAKRFIRCAKEGKPERGNLQDVTIVFDTCLGYDIILAMRTRLDELRRENPFLAHIPPEDIGIPTVVSLANAGSLLYGKKDVSPIDYFVTHGQSIKDGMTGKFLLQQYQPDNYIFGDTAVFAPQYGAKDQIMIEVAKRKQKKDEYSLPLAA